MKLTYTNNSIIEMSNTKAGICNDAYRQSERDVPYLGYFRKAMSVKLLNTKDRFGRIFCIYLSLMSSHLICDICKSKKGYLKMNAIHHFSVLNF